VGRLLAHLEISLGFTLVACATWWLAQRLRRRRGGDVRGSFEEIWHPAAHLTRIEIREQVERKAPSPAPGDPLRATGE